MITVMLYGIIVEKFHVKTDTQIAQEDEKNNLIKSQNIDKELNLSVFAKNSNDRRQSFRLDFSAVVIIVPKNKEYEALSAARDAGAVGVTILNANGLTLNELENFYRHNPSETDKLLLFIVPSPLVNPIIKEIIKKLHITSTGHGIAFCVPITHLKGISLEKETLFKYEVKDIFEKEENIVNK